ncbi:hypothetical protein [Bhargavaea beijingensis]|uniref:hypothetical protein n=1 Tax=Bhargavaea beijingensis TaxID=426756 RepID=UPI00222597EB|nr:hypothetical protein [Bhargavaea beijingensis]MCW1926950.1 hypothetical protein [Bhargavaea beijingensis]
MTDAKRIRKELTQEMQARGVEFRCIRSLRIVRELSRRYGILPWEIEPSKKSQGYHVFIFRVDDYFQQALDEIMEEEK